jgi:hypothetical protein
MKKLILSLMLLVSAPVFAQHHWHGGHGGRVGGYGVWPLLIGGTVGYIAAREINRPVIVQQPVYNNTPPVYNLPNPPYVGATPLYEKRTQFDNSCNCYVVVYNQIGWQ